jgi:hypothetical protein
MNEWATFGAVNRQLILGMNELEANGRNGFF